MTKILIATGNQGKFKEIMEVLHDLPNLQFLSLQDLSLSNDVEESGNTYEENSLLKAQHFFKTTGIITLAEDSGIEVEAIQNELGVKTRRWGAGENANDEEWLQYFLHRMQQEKNKRAKFVCVPTIMWGNVKEEVVQFRGETSGIILNAPQCPLQKGIPISSVFQADGSSKVYAALAPDEKNKISHRGKAIHQVKDFLEQHFC